jgi:hypothetical protein
MLALERAPCAMLELCTCAPLVSLAAGLWLNMPALLPQWGMGSEIHRGAMVPAPPLPADPSRNRVRSEVRPTPVGTLY